MLHFGHAAETAWMSSAISMPQPTSEGGGVRPPRWFSLRKHPLAVVHGGRPHALRYAVRSASARGLS